MMFSQTNCIWRHNFVWLFTVFEAQEVLSTLGPLDLSFLLAAGDGFVLNALVKPEQILTNAAVLKVRTGFVGLFRQLCPMALLLPIC